MAFTEENDARMIVRMLADTAAAEGGHQTKKMFLMRTLCEAVGADAWVWVLGCQTEPGGPQIGVGFLHGGFDEQRFARLLEALEDADASAIAATFYAKLTENGRHHTLIREEIDRSGRSYEGKVGRLWENADIGAVAMSAQRLDESSLSVIGLYRRFGSEPFTEREKQIIHIVLSEVPWLHLNGWPQDRGATLPTLSPRQRIILNLLMEGMGRKQIADQMGISPNTVAGYTREVYRHFGVHSQAELMRRFLPTGS